MLVRFWGTRGSIAAPGPETLRYGGNTPCVEVRTADGTLLILDAGTGIRKLGAALARQGPISAHLLISHTHLDHIQGLPFFQPALQPGNHLTVYGPPGVNRSLSSVIEGMMDYAYFPVPIHDLPSTREFKEIDETTFSIGAVRVRTRYMNHTAPCLGYRFEVGGASLVYATDHEPHAAAPWRADRPGQGSTGDAARHPSDARHVELLRGADLVIHDAQYTAAEYAEHVGWGHSPAEHAVDSAIAAGVKRLALFHHDPARSDAEMDSLLAVCRARVQAAGASLELEILGAMEGTDVMLEERDVLPNDSIHPRVPRPSSGVRVLLADDDAEVVRLLEWTLKRDGYDVVRAANGTEVLALLQSGEEQFDLVLVDAHLQDLSGFEVARRMRADPRFQHVPVVMLTNRDEEDLTAGYAQGVTDYLSKPLIVAQVRARVRAWLSAAP